MRNKILILIIYLGSVFIVSGKFVDETNSPRLYFVMTTLLGVTIITAILQKQVNFSVLSCKTTLHGLNIICFLQASYGLLLFTNWLPTDCLKFAVTGSFDNPTGFAAVLVMGLPIGLYLLSKSKKIERYFVFITLVVIAVAIFFSKSRAGVLSILISTFIYLLFQTNIIQKFQELRYNSLLLVLGITLISAGCFALYHQKKDSADGRLLIWKVSSGMIMEKPILGHGYGAFQAKYMDYQAAYFKKNPYSRYEQLADNVKHPFNEFVKVAVEFGIIGLAITFSSILFVLQQIVKSKNENRGFVLSGLASFLVFACFSYPLQYVAVWLMLAFYLLLSLPSKEFKIKHTPVSITARIVIIIACTFSLFHITRPIQAEIKWKTIAMNSLQGNTEEMLSEYEELYSTPFKRNPFFLYNYGAELNVANQFNRSIKMLNECQKKFNDYDLQMLLADNYYKIGETEKAIKICEHASNMIPCRFLPLFKLFEIYKEENQKSLARKFAVEIINKIVKIESSSVSFIKSEAKDYLGRMPLQP